MKIRDFINEYKKTVPLYIQEEWDNSGCQFGNKDDDLKGLAISLDFGIDVVSYAIEHSVNLIFTHHPVFFKSIKNIDFTTKFGNAIEEAIKNNIFVYSSHTNLDFINGGVNDVLSNIISLKNTKPIIEIENKEIGLGRYGYIDSISIIDFINFIKEEFNEKTIISYGNLNKNISKVGIVGGSGASVIQKAIELNLDLLITSDIKYHDAEFAVDNNLNLIDLGHFVSEKFVLNNIYNIFISKYNFKIVKFYYDKSMRNFL